MKLGVLATGATAAALLLAGPTPSLAQVGQQAPQQQQFEVEVDSIVVRGNQRIPASTVIQQSALRPGTVVSYPSVQDAIHRLFATGDFSDVRISVTEGDPAVFFIDVEEHPFVARYAFEGLESVSPGTVRDTVGLFDGEPLDLNKVARTREVLSDLLSAEGFPRATIDTSMSAAARGTRLVFRVEEGPRLGLARIDFEGNEAFTDAELRGTLSTGEEGFFWFQSGELKRDQFEQDLKERLPRFYASHGYIDFAVVDDTVIVDESTGKGRVTVWVDEGPQYRLAEFTIRGNREFPTEELRRRFLSEDRTLEGLPVDSLPPFDQTAFSDARGGVSDLYRNAGYLRASVVPVVERLPADSTSTEGIRLVRATWDVQEGEPAYIREVNIVGNDYTHDRIIRQRLSILPGDIYSQQRLINSVRAVQSIGFFEALPPQEAVQIDETPEGDVDITLRVQEKQTGNLNFGLSASAGTGLAGFIGYEQPNLFGQAKSGRFRWLFGGRTQDIELSYSDPEVFGSDQSATATVRSSRDRFRTFSLGERRQTGGSLEVGTPFFDLRATRLFVGYSLFRDEVRNLQLAGISPEDRQLITEGTRSTMNVRLVRDTRTGGTFPTGGSRHAFTAQFTGGPLGGDGDFGKYELESRWFVPVAQLGGGLESQPVEFTAGLSVESGWILGTNPFFRERFFMGGVQIGKQLRGYEEATITPQGHIPRNTSDFSQLDRVGGSYFLTSAMFGAKLTGSLFASAFLDAGNVYPSASQLNPTDLLVGAGVGVSLVTPFGPLGIDYAYGFDRRDVLGRPDPGWKLHFKFGRLY